MDWAVLASVIAALAGLIAAFAQAARLMGDHAWYRRWLEVLDNAANESQKRVAEERIQHYVQEFAVTDRTRKRRRAALGLGAFLLLAALLVAFASAWWFAERVPAIGWGFAGIGILAYALGLLLIVWIPDRERARARTAIDGEFAIQHSSRRRRWWHLRSPSDAASSTAPQPRSRTFAPPRQRDPRPRTRTSRNPSRLRPTAGQDARDPWWESASQH